MKMPSNYSARKSNSSTTKSYRILRKVITFAVLKRPVVQWIE